METEEENKMENDAPAKEEKKTPEASCLWVGDITLHEENKTKAFAAKRDGH